MTSDPVQNAELEAVFRPLPLECQWALAVSGGCDSMALMVLAARWRALAGANAPQLSVLTVDHGLRAASAGEAEHVARAAASLDLPHEILRWSGEKPASGVQAAARAARYDLMVAYAHAHATGCLVTAHHLDDQAETLLMRLGRGSGVDGLAAIPGVGQWAGIPLFRPLLNLPRARLVATLEEAGIGWLDDPSNEDEYFERVRVRKAMPVLQSLGLSTEALARTAMRMQRARQALDQATDIFLKDAARMAPSGYCELERGSLLEAPEEIALRALKGMVEAVRGGDTLVSLSRLEDLTRHLREDMPKPRTLGGCRIFVRGDNILVVREAGRTGLKEISLEPGSEAIWDRRFKVAVPASAEFPLTVRALGRRGMGEVKARAGRRLVLPPGAAAALVSFWRDGRLVAVPPLEYFALEGWEQPDPPCAAHFVNAHLFNAQMPH